MKVNVKVVNLPGVREIFGARGLLGPGNVKKFAQYALNDTANILRGKAYEQMRQKFDSPREFTVPKEYDPLARTPTRKGSLFVKPLRDSDKPQVMLGVKDDRAAGRGAIPPSKYLAAEIEGGPRKRKRSELRLGATVVQNQRVYYVPGRDIKLDASNDVTRGQLNKIFSGLQIAEATAGFQANETQASRKRKGARAATYIVIKPAGQGARPARSRTGMKDEDNEPGIYAVRASGKRDQLLRFIKPPSYSPRINPIGIAERGFAATFNKRLNDILDRKTGVLKQGVKFSGTDT